MVLRGIAFDAAGMFDGHTFLYCEEPILAERLAKENYRVYFCNKVQLIHEGGYTTGKPKQRINIKKTQRLFESEMYYYKKYRNTSILRLGIAHIAYNVYIAKMTVANMLLK